MGNLIPFLVALYFCGDQSCLLAAITSLNSPNQDFLYRVYPQKSIPAAKIPVMYFTVTFSFWESMPGSLINLSITFKTDQATHNLSQNGFPPIYKELISKDSAMKNKWNTLNKRSVEKNQSLNRLKDLEWTQYNYVVWDLLYHHKKGQLLISDNNLRSGKGGL